ncbi:MAG: benzoate/H(+) symporter BenE family transporter [Actinobacteria bacterium]|nr:benzoate/H(+) symporter BenE family transporter [Actinomycetota bacterium]MBU1608431.1 benzoate/H(+) symporter BenE family transporter [Actinomycetota bacterium]MBU2316743.1 benzoate/H(+) symporter BenE family transporter [Actinomycetota bacterium]MBU2385419.1 benzoate/H(+) symporter BenE family transporter [Actinomycetota bacterium]
MLQPIIAGVIGALTGFASSFALVIAGLLAVGASPQEAASGLLALCVAQALLAGLLSWRSRLPLSFAWSTPGAALLVAAEGSTGSYGAAIGAFIVCGLLILVSGLWGWLGRAMTRIPMPLAGAMLAGILFPICIAPVTAVIEEPLLAAPVIVVWLLLVRWATRWAVPAAMLVAIIGVVVSAGSDWMLGATLSPGVTLTMPTIDPLVIVSLGVPLYIVTMAGQNVPGFAVLSTLGYREVPARRVLASSGLATAVSAPFGGFALNLAALTAALMAGPDSHPDPARRWVAPVAGGVTYVLLGLGAGVATALVAAAPPILIIAVAGLALLGAFTTGLVSAFEAPETRLTAAVTLIVVASGVVVLGIGSAFWGLVVGAIVLLVTRPRRVRDETVDDETVDDGTVHDAGPQE